MNNKDFEFYFNFILTKGKKDNTYKFALARFLLDYSRKLDLEYINKKIQLNEDEIIEYKELAKAFLRYYWHQECKYKIRQNPNPAKPPSIIKIIRRIFGTEYNPKSFKEMPKELISKAEREIQQNVFGSIKQKKSQVVPRFQNISEGRSTVSKKIFYDYDGKKIKIKPRALYFFHENYYLLFKVVILEWSKFLEKMNTLPRLISKTESDEIQRNSLAKYRKILEPYFENCFYCGKKLEGQQVHVDHFIPWSYIFEDELWNFVLSCSDCNCNKLDSLAPKRYTEKIIERNKIHRSKIPELKKSLNVLDSGKGWEKALKDHYENCRAYGFTIVNLA